jgi:hypothetical protein
MFNYVTILLVNPIKISQFFTNEKHFRIFMCILNLIYITITGYFVAIVLNEIGFQSITIGFTLVFFSEIMPFFLQIAFALDILRSRKIQLIDEMASALLSKCGRRDLRTIKLKFMARQLVLITVRLIKFLVSTTNFNVAYAACTMIGELMLAASDFVFTLYCEALESRINESVRFVRVLLFTPDLRREMEREIREFAEIREKILQIYASRILITTIFNLILLVISLYWTTMRLVFNHFETLESYATFLYLIQPILCIWTTFYSANDCTVAVREVCSVQFA